MFSKLSHNVPLFFKAVNAFLNVRWGSHVTLDNVHSNRQIRAELVQKNLSGPDPITDREPLAHRRALKQFYMGRFVLFAHIFSGESFTESFPDYKGDSSISSKLDFICSLLQHDSTQHDKEKVFTYIELRLRELSPPLDGPRSSEDCVLYEACSIDFLLKDACGLIHDLASHGKSIFIQNAANAQRFLGGATYQSGTLEERLAQCTSLFEESLSQIFLRDGHNAERIGGLILEEEKRRQELGVLHDKAELLHYIYQTLSESIKNPEQSPWSNNECYTHYLRNLFGMDPQHLTFFSRLPNHAYEIPYGSGHLAQCVMFDPRIVIAETFPEDPSAIVLYPCSIAQVAAVDHRSFPGLGVYDYACSTDKQYQTLATDLNQLGKHSPIAKEMNRLSIAYTFDQALATKASVILLNLFGCGAFGNDPEDIARLFLEEFKIRSPQFLGKQVVFFGLPSDDKKLQIMAGELRKLDFSCFKVNICPKICFKDTEHNFIYEISQLNIGETTLNGSKCLVSERLKSGATSVWGIDTPVPNRPQDGRIDVLIDAYRTGFKKLMLENPKETIAHTILLGTGKHRWSLQESVHALHIARQSFSDLQVVRVYISLEKESQGFREVISGLNSVGAQEMDATDVLQLQSLLSSLPAVKLAESLNSPSL